MDIQFVIGTGAVSIVVLGNDSDVDGDSLTLVSVTQSAASGKIFVF